MPGMAATGEHPTIAAAPVVQAQPTAEGGARQMMLEGMPPVLAGACPDCGSQLEFAEGCMKCHVCGFSECG